MVDTVVLETSAAMREGSSPFLGTKRSIRAPQYMWSFLYILYLYFHPDSSEILLRDFWYIFMGKESGKNNCSRLLLDYN